MTDTTVPRDLLTGLPSRRKIAELILSETPSRDTFAGSGCSGVTVRSDQL